MTADDNANLLYYGLLLVLVVSALVAQRIPMKSAARMMVGWALIFFIAFVLFALRDDFRAIGSRLSAQWSGRGEQQGESLRLPLSDDGHYWVVASVNGRDVRFLVDSGATITSLSAAAAMGAGVEPNGGFPVMVNTANGVIKAERARIAHLKVGNIERSDFPVHISAAFGDTNVLGMNFLSSLASWRVEDGGLVLQP